MLSSQGGNARTFAVFLADLISFPDRGDLRAAAGFGPCVKAAARPSRVSSFCRSRWNWPTEIDRADAAADRNDDDATALDGPGTGWDLHELRHSGLTHLGEFDASPVELMAKSRHSKAENLCRYFKPSPQAMRELTSILGPGAER